MDYKWVGFYIYKNVETSLVMLTFILNIQKLKKYNCDISINYIILRSSHIS